jgi:hypothetical protein
MEVIGIVHSPGVSDRGLTQRGAVLRHARAARMHEFLIEPTSRERLTSILLKPRQRKAP